MLRVFRNSYPGRRLAARATLGTEAGACSEKQRTQAQSRAGSRSDRISADPDAHSLPGGNRSRSPSLRRARQSWRPGALGTRGTAGPEQKSEGGRRQSAKGAAGRYCEACGLLPGLTFKEQVRGKVITGKADTETTPRHTQPSRVVLGIRSLAGAGGTCPVSLPELNFTFSLHGRARAPYTHRRVSGEATRRAPQLGSHAFTWRASSFTVFLSISTSSNKGPSVSIATGMLTVLA